MPDQLMQIWDKAEAVDMSRYEQSDYAVLLRKFFRLIVKDGRTTTHTPELIGWYVLKALTARAPAWRYAVVYKRLLNWSLPMALPARWLDRVFALALGFKRLPRAPAAKQD